MWKPLGSEIHSNINGIWQEKLKYNPHVNGEMKPVPGGKQFYVMFLGSTVNCIKFLNQNKTCSLLISYGTWRHSICVCVYVYTLYVCTYLHTIKKNNPYPYLYFSSNHNPKETLLDVSLEVVFISLNNMLVLSWFVLDMIFWLSVSVGEGFPLLSY